MKKYLVTGAAGFIGSCVAQQLVDAGNEVYTIDNLSTGTEEVIPKGVHFIKGDCQNEEVIAQLDGISFDAIYHIAGQSSGEVSFENPVYDLQTNTQSTLLLLKLALRNNIKKFVYASTMSVYGDQKELPVTEESVPNPKSFYGVGKLASEHYLRIYSELGVQCTALRLFNVYGPGQNLANMKQGMVSIFIAQALQSQSIHVKGSKDRFRDFVYIDDVVSAFLKCEARTNSNFAIYNIASGVKTTVDTLVEQIKINIDQNVSSKYEGSTPGDQFGIYADNSLIGEELGWSPKQSFSEGLGFMIQWARSSFGS